MSETTVQRLINWYSKELDSKSLGSLELDAKWLDPEDQYRGKIYISIQGIHVIGSITFWNSGSVSAHLIHTPSKREFMLDDRQLTPSDGVELLIQGYLKKAMELENLTGGG